MSKKNAMDALLFGSYVATAPLGPTKIVPELSGFGLSESEIGEAASELMSLGLITPLGPGVDVSPNPFRCSYEITSRGKQAFLDPARKSELGLFTIVIATGGSVVHMNREIHNSSNVIAFEQNMLKQIQSTPTTDQEKEAARSKLKEFLAHPLLSSVIGAALGAVLKSP